MGQDVGQRLIGSETEQVAQQHARDHLVADDQWPAGERTGNRAQRAGRALIDIGVVSPTGKRHEYLSRRRASSWPGNRLSISSLVIPAQWPWCSSASSSTTVTGRSIRFEMMVPSPVPDRAGW